MPTVVPEPQPLNTELCSARNDPRPLDTAEWTNENKKGSKNILSKLQQNKKNPGERLMGIQIFLRKLKFNDHMLQFRYISKQMKTSLHIPVQSSFTKAKIQKQVPININKFSVVYTHMHTHEKACNVKYPCI